VKILEVTSEGFSSLCQNLAQISGKTYEEVLLHQTAAVLNNCLKKTKQAKKGIIVKRQSRRNNYVEFASGHIVSIWKKASGAEMFLDQSTYSNKRSGGHAPRIVKGMTWHQMAFGEQSRRWSPERWARWIAYEQAARRAQVDPKKAAQAAGLTAQSWLQCAQDLGIQVTASAQVRAAQPSNGKIYRNGSARRILEVAACYIEIANDNPILLKGKIPQTDGSRILKNAIEARRKAFEHEMRTGVFKDLKTRAQRYPGLFVAGL
jgi:SHS2 domain-containing protein